MEPIIATASGYPIGRWAEFVEAAQAEITHKRLRDSEIDISANDVAVFREQSGPSEMMEIFDIMQISPLDYATRKSATQQLSYHTLRTTGI